jgi:hypothetical protein
MKTLAESKFSIIFTSKTNTKKIEIMSTIDQKNNLDYGNRLQHSLYLVKF